MVVPAVQAGRGSESCWTKNTGDRSTLLHHKPPEFEWHSDGKLEAAPSHSHGVRKVSQAIKSALRGKLGHILVQDWSMIFQLNVNESFCSINVGSDTQYCSAKTLEIVRF